MTCSDFYMNINSRTAEIECKEGDMRMTAEVQVDDFAFALLKTNDNLDYLEKPVKAELICRAKNAWDMDRISDEDLESFKKVLEVIL